MDNGSSTRGGQVAGWVDPEPIRRPPPDPVHVVQILAPDPSTQPNVDQPDHAPARAPYVANGAEFEVIHMITVGGDPEAPHAFQAGDRVRASDLGEHADIGRLLRLEAIKPLAPAGAGKGNKRSSENLF